ncbi:MAG: hypothetical protein AAFN30_12755, partial [Actinomycetota bacterium]
MPLWPVALARMLMGLLWLYALRWKLPPDFDGGGERSLADWVALEIEHAAFEPYGRLLSSVVLPNLTFFSWAVFGTELLVGISLLLGSEDSPGEEGEVGQHHRRQQSTVGLEG